ncbi:MAG: AEC family transporter [Spirochaetaceae bacterium]|jgi:predicted permease|nr:AEC family transporter [Spirochaetaceae bacterium]
MESIVIAVQVVMPLFMLLSIGFIVRRLNVVSGDGFLEINTLCFKILLPVLLFKNIESSNLAAALNPRVMIFTAAAQAATTILVILVIPRIIKDPPQAASCAQGTFRSNFVAMGIPLVSGLLDADGMAMVSLMSAVAVPGYNVCSVFILELLRGGRPPVKRLIRNIVTNPLIIGSTIGTLCLVFNIHPTGIVRKCVNDIAASATPVLIICLGGLFNFGSLRNCFKAVAVATVGRLLVLPAISLAVAYLVGFRGSAFLAVTPIFVTPTATASFAMAKQMGADGDSAALIILVTTALSLITMAFWIALTHHLRIW